MRLCRRITQNENGSSQTRGVPMMLQVSRLYQVSSVCILDLKISKIRSSRLILSFYTHSTIRLVDKTNISADLWTFTKDKPYMTWQNGLMNLPFDGTVASLTSPGHLRRSRTSTWLLNYTIYNALWNPWVHLYLNKVLS